MDAAPTLSPTSFLAQSRQALAPKKKSWRHKELSEAQKNLGGTKKNPETKFGRRTNTKSYSLPGTKAERLPHKKFNKNASEARYASWLLRPTDLLTGVKCRATSVAKSGKIKKCSVSKLLD